MLNLDTHILIFALTGELSSSERRMLSGSKWCVSDIVLWEITKLQQLGRIEIDINDSQTAAFFAQLETRPISIAVCREIMKLDFRGDPADEIIAATSLAFDIPLLTRDKRIKRSKLVPLAC